MVLLIFPFALLLTWCFVKAPLAKKMLDCFLYPGPVLTPTEVISLTKVQWELGSQLLGFCSSLIAWAPSYVGLYYVRHIFGNYRNGIIFSTDNASCYNRLSWLFIFNALIALPVSDGIMTAAATFSNGVGNRYICIGASMANITQLVCGVLFIIVSWVMLEASKLADEQRLTI